MHEEALNAYAFAKKGVSASSLVSAYLVALILTCLLPLGSPRKDKLPTMHAPRIFCRTCQTNQTLYLNLLSNYLPSEDDPNYESLYAQLPQYRASLDARYPLVCPDCATNVEDEIKKSERLGRTNALGSWLRDGPSRPRLASPERSTAISIREAWMWRLRGLLWAGTTTTSIVGSILGPQNCYSSCAHYLNPSFLNSSPFSTRDDSGPLYHPPLLCTCFRDVVILGPAMASKEKDHPTR